MEPWPEVVYSARTTSAWAAGRSLSLPGPLPGPAVLGSVLAWPRPQLCDLGQSVRRPQVPACTMEIMTIPVSKGGSGD